jgi:hypothetical protein
VAAALVAVMGLLAALVLPRILGNSPSSPVAASAAGGTAVSGTSSKADRVPSDTGWRDLPMLGGWTATGDGARYRVEQGICYLQLHVAPASGVWPEYTQFAELPPAARPAWHMGFVATRSGLPFGEVKVFSDGRVFVVVPSTAPGGDLTVSASFPVGP